MPNERELETLRERLSMTIQHATNLLADMQSLDDWLVTVDATLADMANGEREAYVAHLCGYDAALPERLRTLVESLADVLAGLTSFDGGRAWLEDHRARLESGESDEAA